MKINSFAYKKENETKSYELLVLNETDNNLHGLVLNYLSEDERESLISIQKDYEEKTKPFLKVYRQFLKTKIVS
jgi:hypothetical protein